ncbi:hypothetical protein LTR17_006954 [Elasticomyces elasticus]|nr:hypothetical protein LTR17_006954 [Elasticomyces elasticus]
MATPTLLGLPPELRNRIFELALVMPFAISIGQSVNRRLPNRTIAHDRAILQQPPLTRINRQTRSEGLAIFYGQNTFLIDHTNFDRRADAVKAWSAFANKAVQEHLTKVSYKFRVTERLARSDFSTLELTLDEAKAPVFTARGPVTETCHCKAKSRLRGLGDAIAAAVTSDQRYRAIENVLVELASIIVPGLLQGLENYALCNSLFGRSRAGNSVPTCLDCGKLQWAVSERVSSVG